MNIEAYIESGILDIYVLGQTSEEENKEIAKLAVLYPEIQEEIARITEALITYSEMNVEKINPSVKAMIMATVDYTERMKAGEVPSIPPLLNESSRIVDYSAWLNRNDMILPNEFQDLHAKIIGYDPKAMTAIIWILDETPYEVHTDEYERFLIVEGTCDITIDTTTTSLVAGDYISIPLHQGHIIKVTSKIPCKAILQRIAA